MTDEVDLDLQREFDEAFERLQKVLAQSRDSFLRDVAEGPRLESEVLAQLSNYSDPDRRRARLIRESAEALEAEIKAGRPTIQAIGQEQSVVSMKAVAALTAVAKDTMEAIGQALHVDAGDTGEVLARLAAGMTEAQVESSLALARGITIARSLTTAAAAANLLVNLRENELESYLNQAPTSTELTMAEALWDLVAEEGAIGIAEHLLVELVGVANPVGGLIVAIARITIEMRRKATELRQVYARGDVDEMLDFADRMSVQHKWAEEVIDLLEKTGELAAIKIEAGRNR
ncbi:MAG: hypothetical protein JST59_16990 [Actinobacteria bacterium]|nr:hypothetical protein [Actinomycetota bacterium]